MLGRQTYRTGKFTMVHAAVLLAFIGLAHVIGPASKAQDPHLSDSEAVAPSRIGA